MSKHYRKESNCLNCGEDVSGKFCSNCGQENIEIKEPFWAFISHGVGHYFHYDSKFKKTLKPFLTKPGQLTKDYIAGRRASHIPPFNLYIFITLIYFVFAPIFNEKTENTSAKNDTANEVNTDILKRSKQINVLAADSTIESYRHRQAGLSEIERDNWLIHFWNERNINYKEKTGENINIYDLFVKYFPKLLFILMSLFAFFLMLNFRRNNKLYMEHLIFTIHLFSFAFFSFFVSEILIYLTPPDVGVIISLISFGVLTWYTYRSIRVVYERSRWVSVRKLFSISILYFLAFLITSVLGMFTIIAVTY